MSMKKNKFVSTCTFDFLKKNKNEDFAEESRNDKYKKLLQSTE